MNFKHTAILLVGLLLCLNFTITDVNAQSKNIKKEGIFSFIGKWALDTKTSKLGLMPLRNAFDRIEIKQVKDSVTIIRSSEEIVESGLTATVQTLPLNGSQSKYRSDIMKRTKVSAIALSNDGLAMIETATFNYDQLPAEDYQTGYVETWTRNGDGKLTIVRDMKMNKEKLNWSTICVYEKDK
ncbi:hypothetical protein J7E50_12765 [Pedobacter sp. ISL-68]|uniref:hypothetical protein n=1 Tax=unclassified Pedobacter TaxID=2628915 RepID=UPI001BEA2FC6|nr:MULTISPECIES: hypothetical protein [unclassified Pedobacter]MBT2561709.1 hypothetical protein [Pedobacter sp. ISL-64]MBT2591097.1 hypothetical protein [Pedobacter sp. ISL-68]